ncbi:MAG TPA: hypothetical protein VKT32_00895 [Chthonomonadaceae bacterium]|nr:hypothetical protein [Chthonomonadaceae bacterium]
MTPSASRLVARSCPCGLVTTTGEPAIEYAADGHQQESTGRSGE